MKILFLSDSNALPRLTPEKVDYEETYIGRVIEKYPDLKYVSCLLGAATLPTLYHQYWAYYSHFKPDLSYTPYKKYVQTAKDLNNIVPESKVYFNFILPIIDSYEAKFPGLTPVRNKYNNALKDIYGERFLDYPETADMVMSDGMHLSKKGHELFYHQFCKVIDAHLAAH